jgi:hypothetical protein
MAIQVVCNHCKNRVMIPDSLREKGLNCPVCGQPMAIPGVTGKAKPPPLGAGSLLNMMESDLVASRSTPPAVGPSAQWHRRRTPPTALWAVLGGLSLLLIMILIAVILKSGCEAKARRGQPNPSVAAEKQ